MPPIRERTIVLALVGLGLASASLLAFCFHVQRKEDGPPAVSLSGHSLDAAHDRVMSLWLVPPEPARTRLREMMARVATAQGLPTFEPHVTILGNVGAGSNQDIASKLTALRGIGPVVVRFHANVTAGHMPGEPAPWSQSAIAIVDESEGLRRLQREAKRAFLGSSEAEPPVSWAPPIGKPHLSLAYVQSTLADDRSEKACQALSPPPEFTATEVVVMQVSQKPGEDSIWQACQRNEWVEVARVTL